MSEYSRQYNNIYGSLRYDGTLTKISKILSYSLGLSKSEGWVYTSYYNGPESLKIRTDIFDLETQKSKNNSEHFISGDIAGNSKEVMRLIKNLADVLIRNDCQCHFEIYDGENLEFVNEYPEKQLTINQ